MKSNFLMSKSTNSIMLKHSKYILSYLEPCVHEQSEVMNHLSRGMHAKEKKNAVLRKMVRISGEFTIKLNFVYSGNRWIVRIGGSKTRASSKQRRANTMKKHAITLLRNTDVLAPKHELTFSMLIKTKEIN